MEVECVDTEAFWKDLTEEEKKRAIESLNIDQIIDWLDKRCKAPFTINHPWTIDCFEVLFNVLIPPKHVDFEHPESNHLRCVEIRVIDCFEILKELRRQEKEKNINEKVNIY